MVVVRNDKKERQPGVIISQSTSRSRSYNIKINDTVISKYKKIVKKIDKNNFRPDDDLFHKLLPIHTDDKVVTQVLRKNMVLVQVREKKRKRQLHKEDVRSKG